MFRAFFLSFLESSKKRRFEMFHFREGSRKRFGKKNVNRVVS